MRLFNLNDDTDLVHSEEKNWLAVWANSPEEAVALYLANADVDSRTTAEDVSCEEVVGLMVTLLVSPAESVPHVERRYEVMRRIGWLVPGESSCDTCGLCAMGMDEFSVCEECYQCMECGCDCADEPWLALGERGK